MAAGRRITVWAAFAAYAVQRYLAAEFMTSGAAMNPEFPIDSIGIQC